MQVVEAYPDTGRRVFQTVLTEFEKFLAQFGFIYPELMAPLSVYAQFAAGIAFVLGLYTRWFGLITCFNFIVAVWMVHWPQDFPGWWPALILVFLGILFATLGAGRYSIDQILEALAFKSH